MNKTYAGIGSRKTPPHILQLMTRSATRLEELGYILYSGGADGADTAFEVGVKDKQHRQIFLPWPYFNNRAGVNCDHYIPRNAYDIAKQFHPAWNTLKDSVKHLMARSTQQILGEHCITPVDFVLCYHEGKGGTTQVCRIAEHYGIPVINMIDPNWGERVYMVIHAEH